MHILRLLFGKNGTKQNILTQKISLQVIIFEKKKLYEFVMKREATQNQEFYRFKRKI